MAIPFLNLLPASARLAYPFVLSGVRRGLSSRQIEAAVRSAGLPISRARSIVPLMREIQRIELQGSAVRNIGKGRTINVNRLPESLTYLRREYSYNVRIRGFDSLGNAVDRYVTVGTDSDQLTPGEIEEAAERMVSAQGQSGTVLEVDATLQSGIRRGSDTLPSLEPINL